MAPNVPTARQSVADQGQSGPSDALSEAQEQLLILTTSPKCWDCGCFHMSLPAIEATVARIDAPAGLHTLLTQVSERLTEKGHDCLGCPVCHPAAALNALSSVATGSPAAPIACEGNTLETRPGWPPLAGDYTVLRHQAPVSICTLTDSRLAAEIAKEAGPEIAIVGGLQTENLGIERLVFNVLANPNIRFLILCGSDSRQRIGHLPGQSLLALAQNGIDDDRHIVGAKGRRPQIPNLEPEAVSHFRSTVQVIDMIGNTELYDILDQSLTASLSDLQPAEPYEWEYFAQPVKGYIPDHMTADPRGYVVIYLDRRRDLLIAEHYSKKGVIDAVIEGQVAQELYFPLIEGGLISRLDHAAYLGRELMRAEQALRRSEPYVQDSAPESALVPEVPGDSG